MSFTYNVDPVNGVLSKSDGSVIPQDDSLQAYQDYVAWLGDGNTPTSNSTSVVGVSRRLTRLNFVNRFTDAEYQGVLTMSKNSVEVEAWLNKMNMVTPDPDGTSIDLDDPRTVNGVTAMCYALEQFGFIEAGNAANRVTQILS